ncbi:MAG: integrase catalytic subunit, partial [Caballeronia mineralivorans]|nr:integrase catalytic subunit [Caballeronia mineralivorans]
DNRRVSGSPSRTNRGAEVRSKERAPGTKKQREFTLDDLNAAVRATCCTPAGPVPASDSRQPPCR